MKRLAILLMVLAIGLTAQASMDVQEKEEGQGRLARPAGTRNPASNYKT